MAFNSSVFIVDSSRGISSVGNLVLAASSTLFWSLARISHGSNFQNPSSLTVTLCCRLGVEEKNLDGVLGVSGCSTDVSDASKSNGSCRVDRAAETRSDVVAVGVGVSVVGVGPGVAVVVVGRAWEDSWACISVIFVSNSVTLSSIFLRRTSWHESGVCVEFSTVSSSTCVVDDLLFSDASCRIASNSGSIW